MEKPDDKEAISSFQALMVSTASRVGTGNIVGVSSAICIGGFGSVFWMWVIAIIGSASALIESTLAQIYKKKGEDGKCYGGPAYYIEAALHCRPLAIVFCIAMILTYAFGFNMLASYNLQSTFSGFSFYDPKVSPWIIGGILAVLTGWCLLGGGSRIVKVTSTLVPVMGLAYIGMALIVVIINIRNVPEMFLRIFEEAFDFKAIFGAFAGSDAGYPPWALFQRSRNRFGTECICFCKCQPSGQTGTGSDAVCLYRHTSSLHGNGDDVYVVWH